MSLRRKEHLLPKINCRCRIVAEKQRYGREPGQMEWTAGLFLLLFLGILLCFCFQISAYTASSLYLEDALAASNLASAVIDLQEYGRSHSIWIEDPQKAYERFCIAVRENLQLNENWEGNNKALVSGKVNVASYIIYNVKRDKVVVQEVHDSGVTEEWQGSLGSVMAPNGVLVEATSVYSELVFPVEGLFGVTVQAHKGQLADIVTEE